MGWACGAYGWGEGVYKVLVGRLGGRKPLGRPRRRWVDNIRMDLQDVGCGFMDWIGLAQDRDRWWTLVSAVMNLRVPWNAGNFLTSCKPVSFSRRTLHHGESIIIIIIIIIAYLLQLSCHSMTVVLTLVQTIQMRIYMNKTVPKTQYKLISRFSSVLLEMWKKSISIRSLTTHF